MSDKVVQEATREDDVKGKDTTEKKKKKLKQSFTRIQVQPGMKYSTPQARESWGSNVKGAKFRKEKGKKKRNALQYTGFKIDGSVKSKRLDQ